MSAFIACQLLDLAGDMDDGCFIERVRSDELVHNDAEGGFFRNAFEQFWGKALDEDATCRQMMAGCAVAGRA